MLQIKCPWCGKRDEEEFTPGGQAHVERPEDPSKLSDGEWADYLFTRENPRGVQLEKWRHTFGCRQWFNLARHTVTHEITVIYPIDGVYHGDQKTEKSKVSKKVSDK